MYVLISMLGWMLVGSGYRARAKLDRENLFWWRNLDITSDFLLSVVALSAEEIISFSVRHRSHLLGMFEYAEVL